MTKASFNAELRDAFDGHLEETKLQVGRIEECFSLCEVKPATKKCEAMKGLVKEGDEAIADHDKGHARDAAIIAAAQKIEHYEISAYGTLRTMATVLGKAPCAKLLELTEDEEASADIKLTELSSRINSMTAEAKYEETGTALF